MWYLDVVVKRLRCIDCLNSWVIKLIVSLSEVKSFFAVLTFYIKMMQRRTLQACSLKHSIKKACFSVQGKIEIILVGQGGSPTPARPPLGYALVFNINFSCTFKNVSLDLHIVIVFYFVLSQIYCFNIIHIIQVNHIYIQHTQNFN